MDVYQGFAATVGLATTLWNAWRSLKAFLDEAGHIDETFVELQRLVKLLHSAFFSVNVAANARFRAYERNGQSATFEEKSILEQLCESRADCEDIVKLFRDTVESIKPPNNGSRISSSEFIRRCHEQWRKNERTPTMKRFLKKLKLHIQTQQLLLVCLVSLGQTEMSALRSDIRSLINSRQQPPSGQLSLFSQFASSTSSRTLSASVSNGSMADSVNTDLTVQGLPQRYVDKAESEMKPTLWAYATSAVKQNNIVDLEQVLEQHPDLIEFAGDNGWTLFHHAVQSQAESRNTEALECLIQHLSKEGFAESGVINTGCRAGKTPVFFAVEQRFPKALELLVKAGADVNKADNGGLKPLEFAQDNSYLNIMDILIENGALVDEKTKKLKLLENREGQKQSSSKKVTKRKGSFQKVHSQEIGSDVHNVDPNQLRKSFSFGLRRSSTSSKTSVRRSSTASTPSTVDTIAESRRHSCCSNCGQFLQSATA